MPLTPELITNEEIVQTFQKAAEDIAEMISKLDLLIGHFESIENITKDQGDPVYDGEEAVRVLGKVLASCVIYAKEYREEPYVNPNLEKAHE